MIWTLIGGFRGLLSATAGAAIAFGVLSVYDSLFDDPRVREAGRAEERILWEEARRRLLAQLEAERKAAQAAIDQIERDYLNAMDRDRKAIESLEIIINELEAGNAGNPGAGVLFDRRLLQSLDAIGR